MPAEPYATTSPRAACARRTRWPFSEPTLRSAPASSLWVCATASICRASRKRLKGLEPSTFCMASRRSDQRTTREMPGNAPFSMGRRREWIRAKRGRSGRIRNLSAAEVPIADASLPFATSCGNEHQWISSGAPLDRPSQKRACLQIDAWFRTGGGAFSPTPSRVRSPPAEARTALRSRAGLAPPCEP
jgi:hypothetical protein